jgi:hypothetical protein
LVSPPGSNACAHCVSCQSNVTLCDGFVCVCVCECVCRRFSSQSCPSRRGPLYAYVHRVWCTSVRVCGRVTQRAAVCDAFVLACIVRKWNDFEPPSHPTPIHLTHVSMTLQPCVLQPSRSHPQVRPHDLPSVLPAVRQGHWIPEGVSCTQLTHSSCSWHPPLLSPPANP